MTDADRIIAAHRAEARRTRRLLLFIFVGIPLLVLLAVGVFLLATAATDAHVNNNGLGSVSVVLRV